MLLMVARPKKAAQDLLLCKKLMKMASEAEQRACREVEESEGSSLGQMDGSPPASKPIT